MHPSVQTSCLENVRRASNVQSIIALCLTTGNTKFERIKTGRVSVKRITRR